MKIFNTHQIKALDAYTIEKEPVSSVDLMERAANRLTNRLKEKFSPAHIFFIFCGTGNNGGDGLVIARLLFQSGYHVEVFVLTGTQQSADFKVNLGRFEQISQPHLISSSDDFPKLLPNSVVIDALFGSGLNRPLDGLSAELVHFLNQQASAKIAVDISSGLFADKPNLPTDPIFKADFTLSFQLPKMAFLSPANEAFVGHWELIDIGLAASFIEGEPTSFYYTTLAEIQKIRKERPKFSHKGSFGHVLVMGGSYGKIGATVLAAKAALRTGSGLVTTYVPRCGYTIMQTALPEAMCLTDDDEKYLSKVPDIDRFNTVAVGPGMDILAKPWQALEELLTLSFQPLVIDADAINLIGKHPGLLEKIPEDSIFTPHPKEFERLTRPTENWFEQLSVMQEFCQKNQAIVVLKGAHTAIGLPNGRICFNSTGNPGMATAGSGDVLTGMIASLLAQGYSPENAAIMGVYLHGLAGDIAAEKLGQPAIIATDIIENIGHAYQRLLP